MSIHDESFPHDAFLDVSDFSTNLEGRFQFPHSRRQQQQQQQETVISDPTGLADNQLKKSEIMLKRQNKSVSYNDIHSEYTKRRYKHVESKVGQYIANMKAEDQKRRNSTKFQRHRSMPEAWCDPNAMALTAVQAKHNKSHFSSAEIDKLHESTSDTEADCSESLTGTSSSSRGRHESSNETSATTDSIDKHAYTQLIEEKERIQSERDYLQTRLDEKIGENVRLKRNVDFMRIELSNCKDKLQRQNSLSSFGVGGAGAGAGFGRNTLPAFIYSHAKTTKATQTEYFTLATTPQKQARQTHHFYATPDSPDTNNNMFDSGEAAAAALRNSPLVEKFRTPKNIATIQPLSLNFKNLAQHDAAQRQLNGNSNSLRAHSNEAHTTTKTLKTSTANNNNNNNNSSKNHSDTSNPSSGDSAIDVESSSPQGHKIMPTQRSAASSTTRRQLPREEFIYYDKRSGHFAALETLDASNENIEITDVSSSGRTERENKPTKKRNSLRRRWLRLFGPCTRCKDHNQTFDSTAVGADDSNAVEQTYTQIPLLEKSILNHCRSLR